MLDALLHAAYMVELCRRVDRGELEYAIDRRGLNALGPIIGELDWVTELQRLKEIAMSTANEHQIGGVHYRPGSTMQHWDWVADNTPDCGQSYFVGQATKYLVRWRTKDGVKDLGKAVHYIDKLVEMYRSGRIRNCPALRLAQGVDKLVELYQLNTTERVILVKLATYTSVVELLQAKERIEQLSIHG